MILVLLCVWEYVSLGSLKLSLWFFKTLYWNVSRVDLQCCISFRCIAKWFSYTYTPVYSFLYSFPIQVVTEHWVEFPVLLLVIYFKYNGVASQLSGASILFLYILNPLRAHRWGCLQWLMAWWRATFLMYWNGSNIFSSVMPLFSLNSYALPAGLFAFLEERP